MKERILEREIARLDSIHDHLETEFHELDSLLRESGFPKGVESLKEVALSVLEDDEQI